MATYDATIQRGLKALALARKHAALLDARLPAGHAATLEANLQQLGAAIPEQKAVRAQARASTAQQHDAFKNLVDLLSAMRTSVKNDDDATAADRKGWGVGTRLKVNTPKTTLAAATSVLRVAKENPQRAAELGVLASDIAHLEQLHAAAAAADDAENVKRANAPLSTKARNQLLKHVASGLKKVGGAGVLAFALDTAVREEFEALLND